MGNSIGFTYIGQKLIAQTFALAGAFNQTRDIHKGHPRWDGISRFCNRGQIGQTCVRHVHFTHIGFNGAKGEVCSLG